MASEPKPPRVAYVYEEDEEGNRVHGTRRSAKKREEKEKEKSKPKPKVSHRSSEEKKQTRSDSGVDAAAYGSGAMMSGARQDNDAMVPREVKIERRRSSAGTSSRSKRYEASSPSKSRSSAKVDEAKYYGIPKSKPIPTPIAQPLPHRPAILTAQSYPARPLSYHAAYANAGSGPPISHQTFWQHQAPQPYHPLAPSATFLPNAGSSSDYIHTQSPMTPRSLSNRFGTPSRTGSGYGFREPVIQQRRQDDYDAGYTSTQEGGRPRASIRTPSNRKVLRSKAELDSLAMPPPVRPTSARPGPGILRRPTDYHHDEVTAPEPQFREPFHERDSRTLYREERAPRRPSANRLSGTYDFGDHRVESANSGRRRQSYYGQSASIGSGASGGSGWEDKAAQAASYQDGVSGSTIPLTADMLRRQRRQGGSSRSTKSSGSRDESDYRQSATTRTTRSVSSPDDENVTIKVTGQARVMVGGAQIDCNEGGEIEIKRQKSIKGSESARGGSEWSTSEYGGDQRRIDDRRSRIDKPAGHSRRRSVSYARPSPPFAQGNFF